MEKKEGKKLPPLHEVLLDEMEDILKDDSLGIYSKFPIDVLLSKMESSANRVFDDKYEVPKIQIAIDVLRKSSLRSKEIPQIFKRIEIIVESIPLVDHTDDIVVNLKKLAFDLKKLVFDNEIRFYSLKNKMVAFFMSKQDLRVVFKNGHRSEILRGSSFNFFDEKRIVQGVNKDNGSLFECSFDEIKDLEVAY